MNKEEMLKALLDDLKSKSDDDIIRNYKKSGIEVVSYTPGTTGDVYIDGEDDTNTIIYSGAINNAVVLNEKFSGAVLESNNLIFSKTIESEKSNEFLELETYDVYDICNDKDGEDAA